MRARYADAVFWIIANDDTEWLAEFDEFDVMSVTACLVQDLFGKTREQVVADLRREYQRQRQKERPQAAQPTDAPQS